MKQTLSLTMRRVAVAGMLGMSTLVITKAADAQPSWGRPTTPRAGACFYRDPYFRGDYFCASAGDDIAFLPGGMNDRVSSIRVFGSAEVTIFQDPRFRGRWTRLEGDVRDLRREGWNDRLSSVRVIGGWGRDRGQYDGRRDRPGIGRIESGEWRDDRRGDAMGMRRGENADAVVRRLYQEILQREPDPQGLALYRNHLNNDRWTEQDVREALLKSPEYRQKAALLAQKRAEDIVARAYRAVLNREPDAGSRVYVDKVLRERWTEEDVVRELRNSPEYRNKRR